MTTGELLVRTTTSPSSSLRSVGGEGRFFLTARGVSSSSTTSKGEGRRLVERGERGMRPSRAVGVERGLVRSEAEEEEGRAATGRGFTDLEALGVDEEPVEKERERVEVSLGDEDCNCCASATVRRPESETRGSN